VTKRIAAIVMALLACASIASAQGGSTESQLGAYVGKWTIDGTGSAGKLSGSETCAWFSGGPSLVCRKTTQDTVGETDSIAILSFDAAKKQYVLHGTDNTGAVTTLTGTFAASTWKWLGEVRTVDGRVTATRYTVRDMTGGSRSLDIETQAKGGTWLRASGATYKRAPR